MKDCIVASAPMALVAADGRSGCSSLAALPKPASRDRQLTRCVQISLLPGFAGGLLQARDDKPARSTLSV
jgi:hypothetical protein